eukprot:CAMPEP_0114124310 /NCGR_PEP_ID=MMETSP0043_2-20121206/8712_1 /TAXON_ID=464988 /ORGANISM="Hemiselmis andersenii, Strain CCMP644" /LENGTH=208 /DNA_ID=CAMNT_0001217187 /DNA_START=1482 /DNA_END=2109 /DNA_ORIENTATION=-
MPLNIDTPQLKMPLALRDHGGLVRVGHVGGRDSDSTPLSSTLHPPQHERAEPPAPGTHAAATGAEHTSSGVHASIEQQTSRLPWVRPVECGCGVRRQSRRSACPPGETHEVSSFAGRTAQHLRPTSIERPRRHKRAGALRLSKPGSKEARAPLSPRAGARPSRDPAPHELRCRMEPVRSAPRHGRSAERDEPPLPVRGNTPAPYRWEA